VVNAQVRKGQNILITGVGGGVALIALQVALAIGANVYVTSGNEDKIKKAMAMGAKGGVNYRNKTWPAQLSKMLVQDGGKDSQLSAVIDSAGGDIMGQVGKLLKSGGKVVVYGM
jgi:NADPH:quinone reductase-like Zn-dependent oxidoreductase